MTERIAEVVILAEDDRHVNFVRRYLQRLGHKNRNIRAVDIPKGRGSGESHVRERYPTEVEFYRNRSTHRKAALVVITDADVKTIVEREDQLATCLAGAGGPERGQSEAICLLIPKRSIETWILCLVGESVNESADYSGTDIQQKIKPAALAFFDWSRPGCQVPGHCVQSLRVGLREGQRIPRTFTGR